MTFGQSDGAPASGRKSDPEPRPRVSSIVGWVLYDLANTIFSLNIISLYFSVWVVNVMGGSDSLYGVANSLSMAVIFLVSPLLGALTDQAPRRLPFLVVATLICVACTLSLGRGALAASLVVFGIANIAYQAGLQFYDSLLPVVSTERNRGRVGGIGIGAGYVGSIIGITTGMLLLGGVDDLDLTARSARYVRVFTASGLLFLAFAIPCFVLVREPVRHGRRLDAGALGRALRQVRQTLGEARGRPHLWRFLIARAFYTDAVNTVIAFMGIYVTNAVGFSTGEAQIVLLVAITSAAAGGFIWGRVVDRLGPKRTLEIVLGLWTVVFVWTALVGFLRAPGVTFWPVPALAGIALGGTWTADRPFMLRLTPADRVGEFYGLYGMVGRFAAITGPLIWVLVAERLGLGRPAAVTALLVFIVIAFVMLRPVSDRST